jgi:hypothetical protein
MPSPTHAQMKKFTELFHKKDKEGWEMVLFGFRFNFYLLVSFEKTSLQDSLDMMTTNMYIDRDGNCFEV